MMTASVLAASIVIPTHNRKDSLLETLLSLNEQSLPPERYEVLVVDDGSIDDTAKVANEKLGYRLSYVYQHNQGAAIARNRGAIEANGDIIIFLDDDIRVSSGFVEAMVTHADRHTVVVGLLYPALSNDAGTFEKLEATANQPVIDTNKYGEDIQFTECLSGIMAVQRDVFFLVGQMQDVAGDGRVAWGDVDFGYRAWKYGCRFWRSYEAIGHHYDFSTRDFVGYCKRWHKAARAAVKLSQKYPDILSYLPMFTDKQPISWGKDSLYTIIRKTVRKLSSGSLVITSMEMMVSVMEKAGPDTIFLQSLYRWIIGAYIFRGFREGLQKSKLSEDGRNLVNL